MQTITKQSVISFYLEYLNNFLTISAMAAHYGMPVEDCEYLVELGQKYNEELSEPPKPSHLCGGQWPI